MKLEICSFSGYKIYPAKGKTYVRIDSRTFRFINGKAESYFLQRLSPRKLCWTTIYRKLNKKGTLEEATKKRSKKVTKVQRGVAGVSVADLKKKRNETPDARKALQAAAIAKAKDQKKAKKTGKAAN